MSSSTYTSEWPTSTPVNQSYKTFFEEFYKISDTPDAHDTYVNRFTQDATLIMASKRGQGSSEILALRKGLWEKVASRQHDPQKIFPYGPNSDEVMIRGTVKYTLKAGGEAEVPWAAYAHLVKVGEEVKMDFYQVYLDTAAQSASK